MRCGYRPGDSQTPGVTLILSLGIDLTSGETKPSACVVINDRREIAFHSLLTSNDQIIKFARQISPSVVAIDAPLSLPAGLCCIEDNCPCKPLSALKGRECERLLARKAIPCYFTTKRSIIKDMVYRGIYLAGELRHYGFEIIEVYPYASKRCSFGSPIPKKTTASGIKWLRSKVDSLVLNKKACDEKWDHDLCDALMAAYTGLLYLYGDTQALGNDEEGYVHVPRIKASHSTVLP